MGIIMRYIASQLGNPRGLIGYICCLCMNASNNRMYSAIAGRIRDKRKILDVGYGNGVLTSKIYRKTGSEIYGVDISPYIIRVARERNRKGIERGDIKLSRGDCCDLQFPESFFDTVVTSNTIYFWNDTMKGLGEIRRVLRPGGVFYNAVYTKEALEKMPYTHEGFRLFSRREYIKMAKEAGFSRVRIIDIAKGTSILIICQK